MEYLYVFRILFPVTPDIAMLETCELYSTLLVTPLKDHEYVFWCGTAEVLGFVDLCYKYYKDNVDMRRMCHEMVHGLSPPASSFFPRTL